MSGPGSGERHKGGVNGEIELIKKLIKASRTRVRVTGQQDSDSQLVKLKLEIVPIGGELTILNFNCCVGVYHLYPD